MFAMKCDRCGKLYEHYINPDERLVEGDANGMRFTLKLINSSGITIHNVDNFDLCPECMDKLLRFMLYEGGGDKKCGAKVL